MVRLFIQNREVELDDTVQFAITSQFENLSNPTDIINDWSKTVSIPFTQSNNELFGHIYNPDKVIVDGGTLGVYFNPLLKLDFRLEWDGAILMTGYAKLNEIKQVDGKGTYEITLFGELGKVFQEMKKITFDESSPETNYIIDGSKYVNTTIDKDLVYSSWTSNGQTTDTLLETTDNGYNVTDIIGFAPNNSFSEGFDYSAYQDSANTSKKFIDELGTGFTEDTGVEPSTAIPNGLLPREIGEYRSYLQLPYIYWNKLFQIFKEKAESITGYQFELDSDWFNTTNPYWYNLVYMLKNMASIKNATYTNVYDTYAETSFEIETDESAKYRYDFSGQSSPLTFNIDSEQKSVLQSDKQHFAIDGEVVGGILTTHIYMNVLSTLTSQQTIKIRNNAVFVVDIYATDGTDDVFVGRVSVKNPDSTYIPSNTTHVVNVAPVEIPSGSYTWTMFNDNFTFDVPSTVFDGNVSFYYTVNGYHAEPTFSGTLFVNSNPSSVMLGNITTSVYTVAFNMTITPLIGKSFSKFTLNTLWNNDCNIFKEVLKYCKMYRIGITIDEFNKKLIFKPFIKYFQTYSVIDWTDKVDKSRDFVIKPITFENKYVLFNYEDGDIELCKQYKEKYGVNYGEYRLVTDYNFNNETEDLFEGIKQSVTNTDNILSWTNLNTYHDIVYSFPAEIYVLNKDKDNKQVDVFGSYFFHNGLGNFSTESALHLRSVMLTDDTKFQQANSTYFYTQTISDYTYVTTYPKLDIIYGDNLCVFNVPKENYTYISNYSGKSSIYTNFWKTYLDERYNIQNKIITCYVNLKPHVYNQFYWNKLVKIGNQLCMVNKIYDYDVTSNQPTKVDLITIQDINGYIENEYNSLTISWTSKVIKDGSIEANPIKIGSYTSKNNSDVTFSNNQKSITLHGIQFTITGNDVYAQSVEEYVDEVVEFKVTIHNEYKSASFDCARYAIYPYPELTSTIDVIYRHSGNNVTLYFDYTPTDDVPPTLTTFTTPDVSHPDIFVYFDAPTASEIIWQSGDIQKTLTRWTFLGIAGTLPGTLTEPVDSITIEVTDANGWHKSLTIPVKNINNN